MAESLIRAGWVVRGVRSRHETEIVEDGAVLQRDGQIIAVGPFQVLRGENPTLPVVGSPRHVMLPGFVNSHHHVGVTPLQLGSPDFALELWLASRLAARDVDLYLDTLYSAFEMMESGITTVQHIHGWMAGTSSEIYRRSTRILEAYRAVGMRASYCYAVRDQNRLVYEADADFVRRLPAGLDSRMAAHFETLQMPVEDHFALFRQFTRDAAGESLIRIHLAPANLHWCSDETLLAIKEVSESQNVPMHIHLLETAYQKEYARRRAGTSAVAHLGRLGLLGPRLTLGHGVWLNEADIELLADSGTCVCHNCSSNFRLRSGMAPLNALEKRGVTVAIGLDEAGINDDRDMLQEMRLILHAHRTPGMDDDVPTCSQVLRMATEGGAMTTPFGARIGRIDPGRLCDLVLIDWDKATWPYQNDAIPLVDAVVQRAKAKAVDAVIIGGEIVYENGHFVRIDRREVLAELAAALGKPLTDDEQERQRFARQIFPHVKSFYDDYLSGETRSAFYQMSSRV